MMDTTFESGSMDGNLLTLHNSEIGAVHFDVSSVDGFTYLDMKQ